LTAVEGPANKSSSSSNVLFLDAEPLVVGGEVVLDVEETEAEVVVVVATGFGLLEIPKMSSSSSKIDPELSLLTRTASEKSSSSSVDFLVAALETVEEEEEEEDEEEDEEADEEEDKEEDEVGFVKRSSEEKISLSSDAVKSLIYQYSW